MQSLPVVENFESIESDLQVISGYSATIDTLTSEEWTAVLLKFEDATIFQTWEYGAAKWGKNNLVHVVLKKGNEIVAAAQIWYVQFPVIGGGFAHISMGPMWRPFGSAVDVEDITHMVRVLREEFVVQRGVLLRIYSNDKEDDLGLKIRQIFKAENLQQTKEAEDVTVLLDLSPDLETIRRNLRKSWRRQLHRAEREELEIAEGTDDTMFQRLGDFYREMLRRKQFTLHVADIEQLADVQRQLPPALKMRIFLCSYKGEFISGQAVSAMGNTAVDMIAAISNRDTELNLSSTYLFEWQTITRMKEQGFKYLDLRGYDPLKYPGPTYYKEGLSGDIVRYLGIFENRESTKSAVLVVVGKCINSAVRRSKSLVKRAEYMLRMVFGTKLK